MSNPEILILLEWFAGRAGDRIKNKDYQVLFPEFARMLVDSRPIKTVDDVLEYMEFLTEKGDVCPIKISTK